MLKSIVTTAVLASTLFVAASAQASDHREPIDHKAYYFSVHPGEYKQIKVLLRKSTHYTVGVGHNPPNNYPTIYPPPRDDVKLRVMRFWKGNKKMDKYDSGLGSASMRFQSTHHGHREYIIKVYNKSGSKQNFRLTVSSNR